MRGAADGLKITAGSSWVHGLVINRFNGDGIELATNGGNLIEGNFIGTDPTGTITDPDGVCGTFDELWNYYGVRIDGSSGNTIGKHGAVRAKRHLGEPQLGRIYLPAAARQATRCRPTT